MRMAAGSSVGPHLNRAPLLRRPYQIQRTSNKNQSTRIRYLMRDVPGILDGFRLIKFRGFEASWRGVSELIDCRSPRIIELRENHFAGSREENRSNFVERFISHSAKDHGDGLLNEFI